MAVTVSKSLDFGAKLVDALGVEPSIIKKLKDSNIKVTQGVNKIKLVSSDGAILSDMSAADGAILLAMKGAIGQTSLTHLKASFESAANQALSSAIVDSEFSDDLTFDEPLVEKATTNEKLVMDNAASNVSAAKNVDYSNFKVEVFPESEMMTAQTVKLKDADKLYQPVAGTSAGSRYFVIALAPDLKVAARYKNDEVSVRVEGGVQAYKQLLKDNQFNIGGDGQYASLHVKTPELILARRVIGAVITGMGLPIVSPVPVFDLLVGKGT